MTVGAAVLVAVAVSGFAFRVGQTLTRILDGVQRNEEGIEELNEKIVGKGPNGWHKSDFRAWLKVFGSMNPSLKIPEAKNAFDFE